MMYYKGVFKDEGGFYTCPSSREKTYFPLGETVSVEGDIEICKWGIHACERWENTFWFDQWSHWLLIAGEPVESDEKKTVFRTVKVIEEYVPKQEDWDRLDGYSWSWFLCLQPKFSDKCDWGKLDGTGWYRLLSEQPQFADYCDWDKLNGEEWALLLKFQPQFSDKCNWGKLDGDDWSWFLRHQPHFSDHCDWEKLDGLDWAHLLSQEPQFAKHCNWKKLNYYDWSHLLKEQPQFKKYRPDMFIGKIQTDQDNGV